MTRKCFIAHSPIYYAGSVRNARPWAAFNLTSFLLSAACFLLAPRDACFGQEAQWDVKYTTPKREYLQQEPVRMNMEWRNTGSKPQALPEGRSGWTPFAIGVAGPGAEKEIHPYTLLQGYERVRLEEVMDAAQPMVHVPPGGSYKLSTWILVGTSGVVNLNGADDPKWSFIFDKPGPARVVPLNEHGTGFDITIVAPKTATDVRAAKLFSVAAARIVLNNYAHGDEGVKALETLWAEEPESVYAPYAGVALARKFDFGKSSNDHAAFERYRSLLQPVIEKHPKSLTREEAIYLLAVGYAFQEGGKAKAAEYGQLLQQQYPEGSFLPALISRLGAASTQPTTEPASAQVEKPAPDVRQEVTEPTTRVSEIAGSQLLPAGAREIFEGYWGAIGSSNWNAAFAYLGPDFLGLRGDRKEQMAGWKRAAAHHTLAALRIKVTQVDAPKRYNSALPKADRHWDGDLCVVHFSCTLVSRGQAANDKEEAETRDMKAVLLRDKRQWRIVTEEVGPPANQAALEVVQQLMMQVRDSFDSITVWQGKSEVLLSDKVKAELKEELDDKKLIWEAQGITLTGEKRDQPMIQQSLIVKSSGNDKSEKRYTVLITLRVEDGRAQLLTIKVEPSADK